MNSDAERELDSQLNSRPQINPHANFEQRIVKAALIHKQKVKLSSLQWLYRLFAEYFPIEPAYLMFIVLLFGLCQGFIITGISQEYRTGEQRIGNMQDYFCSTQSYL